MSSQNKHWFFLYFVNGDCHISPQKTHVVGNIEIYTAILDNNNGAFIIHHYLRKRFWIDIITEFKYISKMMFIVMIVFTTSD